MHYGGSMGREMTQDRISRLHAEARAERLAAPIVEARSNARRARASRAIGAAVAAMLHPFRRVAAEEAPVARLAR